MAEEEEDLNNYMEIYIGKIEQDGSKSASRSEAVNDSFSQVFVNRAGSWIGRICRAPPEHSKHRQKHQKIAMM